MGRKRRVLKIALIAIAAIAVLLVVLVFAAGRLLDRTVVVKNPAQAKANGERLLKDSKVILAVGAHPDDLEYYTGGTLGTLAAEGKTVIGVLSVDKSYIQETRRAEARQAAGILGYKPLFLGHAERDFENGITAKDKAEIQQELETIIKKYKVDTVLAYDSADQGPVYHHIDHILTGEAAQAAAKEAGVKNVYLYFSADPNTTVDVKSVITKKSEAMAAHVSQHTKWYMTLLRPLFGWLQPTRSTSGASTQANTTNTATPTAASDDHHFGNTESFRKL
jgi:LmbE family N-acetylglucosaminyl deacetylase